ncbi:Motility protein B [Thalassoglobus neptunius]|uniref:Motility protein B n=1 Tax=Thalassoglobus neptunius TaxID=1938619 RepID=A0A5C5X9P8_9PLAN|nr:OmpA family protein [Thalassoglobus neptunius]TWT59043.1 Motility protein B [Thalassoglobus neptunius]
MSQDIRKLCLIFSLFSFVGCHGYAPAWQVRQAQLRTYEMYHARQHLATELAGAQQSLGQMAMEKQQLEQSLAAANQRIDNLAMERSRLQEQYTTLLTNLPEESPLSGAASRRLQELAERYSEFEFDPATGISRFTGDLLFATGSDQVQSGGSKVLNEFAAIMNSSDTRDFNIVVVGHTDDQPVSKPSTRSRHETNWELSAHRATAVVKTLAKSGLSEPRMSIAGYSMYQPTAPNSDESGRQQNRRVEIFIVAPDTSIASNGSSPMK